MSEKMILWLDRKLPVSRRAVIGPKAASLCTLAQLPQVGETRELAGPRYVSIQQVQSFFGDQFPQPVLMAATLHWAVFLAIIYVAG